MRKAVAACLLTACSFHHGALGDGNGDGSVGDDASDGRTDDTVRDACVSFSSHLDTCTPMVTPGGPLLLSGTNTFDTDTQTLTTQNGAVAVPTQVIPTSDGDIVAILVTDFSFTGTLRVTGDNMNRPFGIVAYGSVQIDGLIDLSDRGAGWRSDDDCDTLGLKGHRGQDDNGGGSGGGGGAFAANGGNGEDGDKDGNSDGGPSPGANGGVAVTARPTHVVGGCDGGGGGDASGIGGSGGHGGGAIFIAAATSIAIGNAGAINAGGGGGKHGTGNGGSGAGGGSGGMIVLESGSVMITGKLAANGGGGGEGADGASGEDGTAGQLSTARAAGGSGNAPEGGDGAGGGANTNGAGQNATVYKNGGGGGGGGGVGFIAIGPATPALNNAVISPPYAAWP